MYKKLFLSLLLVFTLTAANAQSDDVVWHTNVEKASEIANKQKKPLMLFFTGSDWCGWCVRLQKEVFTKPEFIKWAKKNVVLVELDFPRKKQLEPTLQQQNYSLQNLFQVQGYPTVWIVTPENKDGKTNFVQLGRTGYVAGGPEKWLEGANQILSNKKG